MVDSFDNYGCIDSSPTEIIDCGGIWCVFFCLEDLGTINFFNTFSYTSDGECDFFKVSGQSKTICIKKEFVPHLDLNDFDIIFCGIVLRWIGFGTAFEISNGIERIVSPYLASGTVR